MGRNKTIRLEVQPVGKKKKGKPRGKPFPKGYEGAAKKGEVRNPWGCGGKTRQVKLLSEAYKIGLQDLAPKSFAKAVGMEEATWAEVISRGMLQSASRGEVPAAKEIREVTEGKTPETVYLSGGKNDEGETLPIATTTTLNINFVDPPKKEAQ